MKLLFSIDHLYLHGGAEKVLTHRVNYLADKFDFDITIVTTEQNEKPPCYELSNKIRIIDIKVNYKRDESYFSLKNIAKIPNHFRTLNQVIKKINPDVIIVLNYSFDFYWIPHIFKSIPKVKEYHSSRFYQMELIKNDSFLKRTVNFFSNYTESKYNKIVVLNPTESNYYKNKNIEVIPNPIILNSQFADVSSKQVIAAGRIVPIKGFEKIIEVWEIVAKEYPDWKLNIYGQGEASYIDLLQNSIIRKNLEDSITIQPATHDLIEKMIQHSIYVMSSVSECFPMVLLESLSVGLPIISFDCPTGPKNIITSNEDGFLVDNQNINSLAEKIIFLINHPNIRKEMSKKGKQNVIRFSEELIMNKWFSLLTNITIKK